MCYASKCQLLQAKGINKQSMTCTTGQNMCSSCALEMAKHRKVLQLEKEVQHLSIDNDVLTSLLQYRLKATSIKSFRKTLSCLPSFANNVRNDSIFGAARYWANTLGILVHSTPPSNIIEPNMTITKSRQYWRKATFLCKCPRNITASITNCGFRSFCDTCSYFIPQMNQLHAI